MTRAFTLTDPLALADLTVFLRRAMRIDDGSVRFAATGAVLAVWVPVLYPAGILDAAPTVLGLRTFALAESQDFDAIVAGMPLVAALDARPDDAVEFALPTSPGTAPWAAISPPRGAWTRRDPVDGRLLETVATAGIAEVAASVPADLGEQAVHRVRSEVWGRSIDGAAQLPAGAAFAALSLGFLGPDDSVAVFSSGAWLRLTTDRGHVLVKSRR